MPRIYKRGAEYPKNCGFQKGKNHKGMEGKKHSEATLQRQSLCKLGELNPMFGRKPWNKDIPCSNETKEKIRLSNLGKRTGEKNNKWKGDNAGETATHDWIKRYYGKANRCENREKQIFDFECSGESKVFMWANINNHIYRKKREDYIMLCSSCHLKYDRRKLAK